MKNNNFSKIKELLTFAYKNKLSDFYRAKYDKNDFNPLTDFNSIRDIERIPFLTKKELTEAEADKILFVKEDRICNVNITSGTTGQPTLIFGSLPGKLSNQTFIKNVPFGRAIFFYPPIRYSGIIQRTLPGNLIILGDIHNFSQSCQVAAKLKPLTIRTTPTVAIILKEYLQKYPDWEKSLKFFILAGEYITPLKKNLLKKLYPHVEFFVQYASSETGAIGYQCLPLARKNDAILLHPRVQDFYLEIINPDTGQKVKLGETGELVLTDFWNHATPLIRYRTGDLVSFHENNCSCKAPGPLLENWGRVNRDFVRVGGFEIRRDMLEKPLLNLKDYVTENFEANIYENFIGTKPKIKVALSLSLKKGVKESANLKKIIIDEFMKNWQLSSNFNLRKAVEAGLFEPLQIEFIHFPESAKTKGILSLR